MRNTSRILCTLLFLSAATTPGQAQEASTHPCDPGRQITNPNEMRVIESCTALDKDGKPASYWTTLKVGAGGHITLLVSGLAQYRRWYENQTTKDPLVDPSQLILYVDDRPLPRFHGRLPDRKHSHLTFDLAQLSRTTSGNADSLSAWKILLTDGIRDRKMRLSVGFPSRGPLPSGVTNFEIEAVPKWWLAVWYALAAGLLALLIWAAIASDMLRVPGEAPAAPAANTPAPRKAYSLARTQMAAWFYAVLVTYVFIYLATGVLDTISETVLGLMGISAATGFAATVVDTGLLATNASAAPGAPAAPGPAPAPAPPAAAAPPAVAPASEGFIQDLMREGTALSLPRLQIAVWTVVLLFIFGRAVYHTLAMPEFSSTLLGLMGISGGTYIGFKPPDKKS